MHWSAEKALPQIQVIVFCSFLYLQGCVLHSLAAYPTSHLFRSIHQAILPIFFWSTAHAPAMRVWPIVAHGTMLLWAAYLLPGPTPALLLHSLYLQLSGAGLYILCTIAQ